MVNGLKKIVNDWLYGAIPAIAIARLYLFLGTAYSYISGDIKQDIPICSPMNFYIQVSNTFIITYDT